MAKKPSRKSGRPSVLRYFAAIPQRAIGDKRFRTRHFRILSAVCRSVDPETGCALMSQNAIAKWANMARQNVYGPLEDLVAWDYLEKIYRGRTPSGRYKTLLYRVKFLPKILDNDTHVDDKDRVTPVGDNPVSPTGVAESDPSFPDIQGRSENQRSSESDNHFVPGSTSSPKEPSDFSAKSGIMNRAGHMPGNPAERVATSTISCGQSARNTATHKASSWENELQKAAEQRICGALKSAFTGSHYSAALEAFTADQYGRALELELQKKWRGAAYLKRVVKLNLST